MYNLDLINRLNYEKKLINEEIKKLQEEANENISDEISLNFALLFSYKKRNTRLYKAYHFDRLLKIQKNIINKEEIVNLISSKEFDFFKEFNNIIDQYFSYFPFLDMQNRNPPLDFYVEIYVLEDCGLIMSDEEFIELKKDHIYFIKKSNVLHLIKSNLVEIIK